MIYSSISFFLIFLLVVSLLHHWLPFKNTVLILVSLLFYFSFESYFGVTVLIGLLGFSYGVGKGLALDCTNRLRFWILSLAIIVNLGSLCLFRTSESLFLIGSSFFILQLCSYIWDVYRQPDMKASHFSYFLTYITMFPRLLSGPLLRYDQVAGQLEGTRRVTKNDLIWGTRRLIEGLAKKILLADTMGETVDSVFALPSSELSTSWAWFGVGLFALQIYFDLSAYTDMALGAGRLLGFELPENFDRPYLAKTLADFWRRWHKTLYAWFKDYVFLTLSIRSRSLGVAGLGLSIITTFSLSGLWHGFGKTFIFWGFFHGLALCLEVGLWGRAMQKSPVWIQHIYVLLFVLVGYVFFRSENMGAALIYLERLLGQGGFKIEGVVSWGQEQWLALFVALMVTLLPISRWRDVFQKKMGRLSSTILIGCYIYLAFLVLGVFINRQASLLDRAFIYFDF